MSLTEEQLIKNCELCIEWHEAEVKFKIEAKNTYGSDKWDSLGEYPSFGGLSSMRYRKKTQPTTRLLTQEAEKVCEWEWKLNNWYGCKRIMGEYYIDNRPDFCPDCGCKIKEIKGE